MSQNSLSLTKQPGVPYVNQLPKRDAISPSMLLKPGILDSISKVEGRGDRDGVPFRQDKGSNPYGHDDTNPDYVSLRCLFCHMLRAPKDPEVQIF